MAKEDGMTRDIRRTLQETFKATPKAYATGVAKLFLASGKNMLETNIPMPKAMYDTNKDLIDGIISTIKNPTEKVNRATTSIMETETAQVLKKTIEYALDDLRTGNLYDSSRIRDSYGSSNFGVNDFDSFGGFDMSFDENGDWFDDSPDTNTEATIDAQVKIAKAQEENADNRAEAMLRAIGTSTEANVAATRESTSNLLRVSMKQHSQMMNAMQNVITQQAASFELLNKGLQAHLEVAREAHNQMMSEVTGIKTLLQDIRNSVVPKQTEQKRKEQDEIIGLSGELNIKAFLKNIKRNAGTMFPELSMIGGLAGGLDLKTFIELSQSNPLQAVSNFLLNAMIPKDVKKQIQRTGRNSQNFFAALLQKASDRGKRFADGESSNPIDALLGLLGVNRTSRTNIRTANDNLKDRAVFSNKTAKAIEEVIPTLLARIEAGITGGPLRLYDYRAGKFVDVRSVIAEKESEARDLVKRSGDTYWNMMERASKYRFKDAGDSKKFQDYIYNFMQYSAENGLFLNPRDLDRMRTIADKAGFSRGDYSDDDKFFKLMMGIMRAMGKDQWVQMSNDFLDARQSRDRNNQILNDILRESGLISAWSGILDPKLQSELTKAATGRRYGLTMDDIEKISSTRKNEILKKGGTGATNYLLGDILNTLRKGIVTYTYSLGRVRTSEILGMSNIADNVLNTAKTQLNADNTVLQSKLRSDANKKATILSDDVDYADDISSIDDAVLLQQAVEVTGKAKDENDQEKKINENYQKLFNSAVDKLKKSNAKPASKIQKLREFTAQPFRIFAKGLTLIDKAMYRILYGADAAESLETDGEPYMFKSISNVVKTHFTEAKEWFSENIGSPLKKFLFDKEEGLLTKLKTTLADVLGIPSLKDQARARADKAKRYLFGEKDENGNWRGGKFSGQLNGMGDTKTTITKTMTYAFSRLLYGDYASTKGVGGEGYYQDNDGKMVPYGKKKYGGVIGAFKRQFDNLQNILFGENAGIDENGNESESRRKWNSIKKEFGKAFPNMAAGGIVGGGIGLLTSLWLPGGPLLGALVGSGLGLVKGSDQLKEYLFGKEVLDANGKPTREGKLISQEVYEGFKKFAPKVTMGTILGGVAGGLGLLPLGMGPVIGSVLGSIGGMTVASDQIKKLIFGDNEDPDSGLLSKNFREKATNQIKRFAPAGMLGALAGSGAWSLISSIGMLPGLSLLPGGPILGFLGAAVGMSNADKFNEMIFGKEVVEEVEEEVSDGEGGTKKVTTKQKKRKGGVFGAAESFIKDKIFKPFAIRFDAMGKKVGEWFQESIVGPLSRSVNPLKEQLSKAGASIRDSMISIGDKITSAFTGTVENNVGKPLGQMFKEKFIDPLARLSDKIFNTIGKILGSIVSAPFKALEYVVAGTIGGQDPEDYRDSRREERRQRRADRRHARTQRRLGRLYERRDRTSTRFIGRISQLFGFGMDEEVVFDEGAPTAEGRQQGTRRSFFDRFRRPRNADGIVGVGQSAIVPSSSGMDFNTTPELSWDEYQKESGGRGTEEDYLKWLRRKKAELKRRDRNRQQAQRNQQMSDRSSQAMNDQNDKTEEKAESDKKGDNTERNRPRLRRKKSDNDYLADIAKYTKAINREIKGQVNGVGWNTAYIKTLLSKQYGELDDSELPEEMEGSKRTIRKRRGIIGRTIDRAKDFLGIGDASSIFGRLKRLGGRAKDGIYGIFEIVTSPFRLATKIIQGVGKGIQTAMETTLQIVKSIGPAIGEGIKQTVQVVGTGLKKAFEFVGTTAVELVKTVGNGIRGALDIIADGVSIVTTTVRSGVEIIADVLPDVAHFLWGGVKAVGKGIGRRIKGIAKAGAAGVSGLVGKITGRNDPDKARNKVKKIGTFEISGGKLDKIADMVKIGIGDEEKIIPFPYIRTPRRGRQITRLPEYSVPVYVIGGNIVSTNANTNQAAPTADGTVPPMNMNITGDNTITTTQMRQFKNIYRRVNTSTQSSTNPDQVYDRLVRDAGSPTDIQAIALVNQLNGNRGGTVVQQEEKSGGFLEFLASLLGLLGDVPGIGTALSALTGGKLLSNFFGNNGGKNGTNTSTKTGRFSKLKNKFSNSKVGKFAGKFARGAGMAGGLAMTALSLAPSVMQLLPGESETDHNALWGVENLTMAGLRGSGLSTMSVADAAQIFKNPSVAQDYINAGKMKGGLEGLGMRITGKAAQGLNKVGTTFSNIFKRKTGSAAAAGLAGDVAEASSNKVISSAKSLIDKILKSFLNNKVVKLAFGKMKSKIPKLITSLGQYLSGNVLTNALKNVGKATLKSSAKLIASAATGGVVLVGFAVADFISGMGNAYKYFKVFSEDVTLGMRITSGIVNVLGGLISTCVPGIGGAIGLAIAAVQDKIVQLIYNVFADDDTEQELQAKQNELQSATDAYNQATGEELSPEEYAKKYEKDGDQKEESWISRAGGWIKEKAGNAWNAFKSFIAGDTGQSKTFASVGKGRGVTAINQKSPLYNRGSNRVMADAGCGPASAAMVASAYGKKLNPEALSNMTFGLGLRDQDGGMNPAAFSAIGDTFGKGFGMRQGPVSESMLKDNLSKKQPVVMMGKGGPFGPTMHYMVADGLSGKGRVSIVDPNNGARKNVKSADLVSNTSTSVYSWGRGRGLTDFTKDGPKYSSGPIDKVSEKLDKKYTGNNAFVRMTEDPEYLGGVNEDYMPNDPDNTVTSGSKSKSNAIDYYAKRVDKAVSTMRSKRKMNKGYYGKMPRSPFGKGRGRGTTTIPGGVSLGSLVTTGVTAGLSVAKSAQIKEAIANIKNDYSGWPADGAGGGYAQRRTSPVVRYHAGVDLHLKSRKKNDSIRSFTSGTVEKVDSAGSSARGKYVIVKDENGYHHIYQHLNSTWKKVGDRVNIGDGVGGYGTTGSSTGLHLHYEVRHPNTPSLTGAVGGYKGYMTSTDLLGKHCVNPRDYLDQYAGGSVGTIGTGTASGGSSDSSGGIDPNAPKGIQALQAIGGIFENVGNQIGNILNILTMTDSEEDESSSGTTGSYGTATGGIGANATENAAIIYQNFKKMGMSDINIAGMLGNFNKESNVDPTVIESLGGIESYTIGPRKQQALQDLSNFTTGVVFPYWARHGYSLNKSAYKAEDGKYYAGIGLGGFTGPRAKALLDYASSVGKPWYRTDSQIDFMTVGEVPSRLEWIKKYIATPQANVNAATAKFLKEWEGGGTMQLSQRQGYARDWYQKIQDGTLGSYTITSGDADMATTSSTLSDMGVDSEESGKGRGLKRGFISDFRKAYGKGASTNITSLNSVMKNLSAGLESSFKTLLNERAFNQDAISQLSAALKNTIGTVAGDVKSETTDNAKAMVTMMTTVTESLATMITLLSDIKTNTTPKTAAVSASSSSVSKTPTVRADDFSSSLSGGNPTDVGAKIVDRLTSK